MIPDLVPPYAVGWGGAFGEALERTGIGDDGDFYIRFHLKIEQNQTYEENLLGIEGFEG